MTGEEPHARHVLAETFVGTLTHACLAQLLSSGSALEPAQVRRAAALQLRSDLAPVYRASLMQRMTAAVARYRSAFMRDDWRFAGAEVIQGDVALDLLWMTSDGTLVADEIKTGPASADLPRHLPQCKAQLAEGIHAYGSSFAGVRLALLATEQEAWLLPGRDGFEVSR